MAMIVATSRKTLVKFGIVRPTSDFKRLTGVHPLDDQQFSYVRLAAPLLDTAVISSEFCGRSVPSFVSPIR